MMRGRRDLAVIAPGRVFIVLVASREDDQRYQVRAIFDNAGFVIPGEDVKIAGVKVGKVAALDVTEDFKAAVVLDITEPGYRTSTRREVHRAPAEPDRRALRGVQADPAALGQCPGAAGAEEIDDGPGKGQYLLPVANTMQTVDIDWSATRCASPSASGCR